MDPLSATANNIAVLGIAYTSCQSLYNIIRGFVEAPKDVRQNCRALQSLVSVLASIKSLRVERDNELCFTSNFVARLEACLSDIRLVRRESWGQMRGSGKGR